MRYQWLITLFMVNTYSDYMFSGKLRLQEDVCNIWLIKTLFLWPVVDMVCRLSRHWWHMRHLAI